MLDIGLQELFAGIVQHGHGAIFALELLLTFLIVGVALSVTDHTRGAKGLGSAPLAIGLSITACESSCTFYSVGMNPVRMLCPAVVAAWSTKAHHTSNDWSRIWIYCAAPLVGGLLAGLVYRFVLNLKLNKNAEESSLSA
ncbi:Aquaporin AQP-Gra1 [Operophtera brumata]|uniref:Aquaporin AQP-Gra1 n=1 Tax=Operophtera brumata TaxID=104452 RepID=A0A0L7L2J9_OPEBR|nr:Aquaporin AQP-Gra1 [Operophtera brumata]